MEALMEGAEAQEVRSSAERGAGAFALPHDGGSVVVELADSPLAHVDGVGQDVKVRDGTGQFQITVCDAPGGVLITNQIGAHRGMEAGAPQQGAVGAAIRTWEEVNAAHSGVCGVTGAQGRLIFRNDFGESRGMEFQVPRKPPKVVEKIVDVPA